MNEEPVKESKTVPVILSAQKREKLMHNNGMQTETIFYNPNDKRYREGSPTYIGPNK